MESQLVIYSLVSISTFDIWRYYKLWQLSTLCDQISQCRYLTLPTITTTPPVEGHMLSQKLRYELRSSYLCSVCILEAPNIISGLSVFNCLYTTVGMGLCQYIDLCFHASSLPCLHTFCHAIPTSFYIFLVSKLFLVLISVTPNSKKSILVYAAVTPELEQHWQFNSGSKHVYK